MFDEEDSRVKRQGFIEQRVLDPQSGRDLAPMSVSDLRLYIEALRGEIARVEAAIDGKQGARGHADQFFKF